jgi:hypothetical protein
MLSFGLGWLSQEGLNLKITFAFLEKDAAVGGCIENGRCR